MAVSASAKGTMAGPRPAPRRLLSESRLARLAADGDSRAFETIFERYHQELYRYCRAILSNPDDAQDALQGTMAAALRSLPGEGREIALRPWLYRVAHNEAISIARRRVDSPLVLEEEAAVAPSAQVAVEDRQRLETLVADLKALPGRQRSALVMRELSGLSYAEIAVAMKTSEGAARQIVYEAREAMRESEQGRATDCREVREAISERDGRILRGRRIRAHLRGCEPCRDFRAGISQRRTDLQALAPPMPAVVASGLLATILGEAGGKGAAAGLAGAAAGSGGAGLAGGGGALAGTSMLVKGGALVAAAVVGAGAAGATGVIDLPGGKAPAEHANAAAKTVPADAGAAHQGSAADGDGAGGAQAGAGRHRGHGSDGANGPGHHPNGQAAEHPAGGAPTTNGQAPEHSQGTPAGGSDGVTGPPEQAQGSGPPDSAGTGTGNSGGNSDASNGVSADPPRSPTADEHTNAGNGVPPEHANGSGNPHE